MNKRHLKILIQAVLFCLITASSIAALADWNIWSPQGGQWSEEVNPQREVTPNPNRVGDETFSNQKDAEFFGGNFDDPQGRPGYVADQIYSTDPQTQTLTSPSMVQRQTQTAPPGKIGVGFGADFLWTPDLQVLSIPLSYDPMKDLTLDVMIPGVHKSAKVEGRSAQAWGLGDIPIHVNYVLRTKPLDYYFSGMLKTATGNPQMSHNGIPVPLGTGSFDIAAATGLNFTRNRHSGLAMISGRYNFLGMYDRYLFQRGAMMTYMAGYSWAIKPKTAYLLASLNGVVVGRSNLKIDGRWMRIEDSLATADLTAGVQFYGAHVEIILPALTGADSGSDESVNRSIAVNVGYNHLF